MRKILLVVVALQFCHADDIYLKNGTIIHNVKVVGQKELFGNMVVLYLFNAKENMVPFNTVYKIEPVPFDDALQSWRSKPAVDSIQSVMSREDSVKLIFKKFDRDVVTETKPTQTEQIKTILNPQYSRPNIHLLAVSALSFGLAWEFFTRAGEYQDVIDFNNDLANVFNTAFNTTNIRANNSGLETAKTRMIILGIVSIGAGLATTVYALKQIEIKSNGASLSIAYNF